MSAETPQGVDRPTRFEWLDLMLASDLSLTEKAVGMLLAAKYANDDTLEAWPSARTIAEALSCNERTARRALHAVAGAGFLEKVRQGGLGGRPGTGSTRWRLIHPDTESAGTKSGRTKSPRTETPDEQRHADTESNHADTGDRSPGHRVRRTAQEQTSEPPSAAAAAADPRASELDELAAAHFDAHLKHKGSKITNPGGYRNVTLPKIRDAIAAGDDLETDWPTCDHRVAPDARAAELADRVARHLGALTEPLDTVVDVAEVVA